MLKEPLDRVRAVRPLIHCITNYVTANDCANILLACGASPIMADDPAEVEEITTLCAGLTLNTGTLHQHTIPAMLAAGRQANRLGRPVVLDPVGAGASSFRTKTVLRLMDQVAFSVIRGNSSEIKTLASGTGSTQGVDADLRDAVTQDNLEAYAAFAKDFSKKTGAVIAITGAIDLVSDGARTFCIRNGHPMMGRVTGAGCQLSAMTAAFAAANPKNLLEAAAAAVCAMGICGQLAFDRMTSSDGTASYRVYLMDAVSRLEGAALETLADYQILS